MTVVNVGSKYLHLKSNITIIAQDTFVLHEDGQERSIQSQIETKSKFSSTYTFLNVSSEKAANVLAFNNFLFYSKPDEGQYDSISELFNNVTKIYCDNSEFSKLDGCLTCRSVLFSSKINLIEN
jgi:N-dimethylarginine dimethylaminohydrolase